eukprot:jgi/Bigna1/141839/aug1.65_g16547
MILDYCDIKFARFLLQLDEYLLARLFAWLHASDLTRLGSSLNLIIDGDKSCKDKKRKRRRRRRMRRSAELEGRAQPFNNDDGEIEDGEVEGKGANDSQGENEEKNDDEEEDEEGLTQDWLVQVVDPLSLEAGSLERKVAYRGGLATQIYLAYLSLHKVEMNITTAPASAMVSDHPAVTLYRAQTLGLPGVDEAPLDLNGLTMQHVFQDIDQLTRIVLLHYSRQFIFEFYKIVGSMDALGNPFGLFSSLGQGLYDFVADPLLGIQKNPKEFGKGLAKGAASLVTSSLGGVTNTASKITGTVGNAIAQLSFDPVYLRRKQNVGKATNIADGIFKGFQELGLGIVDGVTGIVRAPIQGAMKGGVVGFFKGAGKATTMPSLDRFSSGLAGVVVKPVAGAFGMVSQTTQGFRQSSKKAGKLVHRWGRK